MIFNLLIKLLKFNLLFDLFVYFFLLKLFLFLNFLLVVKNHLNILKYIRLKKFNYLSKIKNFKIYFNYNLILFHKIMLFLSKIILILLGLKSFSLLTKINIHLLLLKVKLESLEKQNYFNFFLLKNHLLFRCFMKLSLMKLKTIHKIKNLLNLNIKILLLLLLFININSILKLDNLNLKLELINFKDLLIYFIQTNL
jgi:hypothetical protein